MYSTRKYRGDDRYGVGTDGSFYSERLERVAADYSAATRRPVPRPFHQFQPDEKTRLRQWRDAKPADCPKLVSLTDAPAAWHATGDPAQRQVGC
jgi:hypothetical protein